jgi:DNA helicase-2/ATP-dependent DNA helicase PcrA
VRIALGKERADNVLHPLPQRPTEEQRIGIALHSWIEERSRGLIGLAEEDAIEDASLRPTAETVELMQRNYEALGYDTRTLFELPGGELATELPFTLKLPSGVLIRGRIDAVYIDADGTLEIVDFKTGRAEAELAQLELYAEALAELGYIDGECKLTIAYLRTGKAEPVAYTPRGLAWLDDGLKVLSKA